MSLLSPGVFKSTLFSITLLCLCPLAGQSADVSFYAVQKAEKYNQGSAGSPTLGTGNPYRFRVTVAPNVSGSVQSATVTAPGGTAQAIGFDLVYGWFSLDAKFPSQAALDAAALTGNYILVVNTLNQGQKTLTLSLSAEAFPAAPHISNWTAAQVINPAADFKLTWDPFVGGTTNDLILVLMGNASTGIITFRSPSPFQPGALDGTATSVVIPTANLQPSTPYQVEITFFKVKSVDATSYPGAVGIVGFSSFTDSMLMTTANPVQFRPSLSAVDYSASGFVLELTGQAGHGYSVQYSADLVHWTDWVTTNLSTSTLLLVDRQATASPTRFYRANLAN